ncbi:biotin transporter BioY [Caldifermentibacillus hisashii]|uniref:biotin transporter BioY n=1 Tax=Caldifermentibacillus hisashii TaxID=996558 RepID=UPI001C12768B|nr:biotin transporter BioY [Caldifermentibacillus hisashii]MBU5341702.1 biotin transporter BioY [Caldifermentibacillus hisashii]
MKTIEITLVSMFVVLIAIGANITSIIPFAVVGGVPITLQTFFAVLSGLILGSRLGAIATSVYAFMGLVGLPVFARFSGGFGSLLSPTFGFILSFILAAYVGGKINEKKKTVSWYVFASLVATAINYLFGTNWMYFAYKFWADAPDGFSYGLAWLWMLPPLPKDIILAVVAGIFAHRMRVSILSKGQFKKLKLGA